MIAVAPRGKLLALTLAALVDRHVTEAFPERAVNAPQFSTALSALHFRLVYIAICGSATSGGRMCRAHREGARAHRIGWGFPAPVLCWTVSPCTAHGSTT